MGKDTLLGNGISPLILDRKMKRILAFQNRFLVTSIGSLRFQIFDKPKKHTSQKILSPLHNLLLTV